MKEIIAKLVLLKLNFFLFYKRQSQQYEETSHRLGKIFSKEISNKDLP
jgi:hypothetical protein